MLNLDDWQKEFIEYQGDKILVSGRQTGKSEAQAYDNGEFAAKNPGTNTLIVSKTERQSQELLIKVVQYLQEFYPKMIGRGDFKPLKNTVWVTHQGHTQKKPNVSRVMCLPVGLAGEGIRGFTIHKLSVDEAQLPPDDVFTAITPMLMTTGGKISLTGTPQGKRGFFWNAFENKTGLWKVFHVNSEDVIQKRPISASWQEWQRKAALEHQTKERSRMSSKQYAQEYLGQFIEDLDQVFSDEWISKVCTERRRVKIGSRKCALGVDVGRTVDPSTFAVLEDDGQIIDQIDQLVRKDYKITETADEVLRLEAIYKFIGIGLDGGGLGAGVVDILLREKTVRRKILDLNNASRDVEYDFEGAPKKKSLLKEDMYRHLVAIGEKGKIRLLDDEDVKMSLKSCQIEYVDGSREVKIFGNDTHIVESIIRAAWVLRNKPLNLWVR